MASPRKSKKLAGIKTQVRQYLSDVGLRKDTPPSAAPRVDVEDALRKFRGFPKEQQKLSKFASVFHKHPILNRPDEAGEVPGVNVGTIFNSRVELSLVKVHTPPQAGIHQKDEMAISIVSSRRYEDDEEFDGGKTIKYTGEGGSGTDVTGKGKRKQMEDQQWTDNNVALRNSIRYKTPVRVVRKLPDGKFIYAGLYKVKSYNQEHGKSGFKIITFMLEQMAGQSSVLSLPG